MSGGQSFTQDEDKREHVFNAAVLFTGTCAVVYWYLYSCLLVRVQYSLSNQWQCRGSEARKSLHPLITKHEEEERSLEEEDTCVRFIVFGEGGMGPRWGESFIGTIRDLCDCDTSSAPCDTNDETELSNRTMDSKLSSYEQQTVMQALGAY